MSDRILVVEDEPDLLRSITYNLGQEGYETEGVSSGSAALEALEREPRPDLVLLDLMLPDLSGVEVCRRIRQGGDTRDIPVIMLTAKGEEIDRVVGFEVGADDYVAKPFSVRELMLRVRAVLKRGSRGRATDAAAPSEVPEELSFGVIRVDLPGHRVWVDEEEVSLTALEFRLLVTFIQRRGRVQSRDRLLEDVWGIHADVTTRTVDTHVKRLREKLGSAGSYLETLRGVGYRFRDRPEAE